LKAGNGYESRPHCAGRRRGSRFALPSLREMCSLPLGTADVIVVVTVPRGWRREGQGDRFTSAEVAVGRDRPVVYLVGEWEWTVIEELIYARITSEAWWMRLWPKHAMACQWWIAYRVRSRTWPFRVPRGFTGWGARERDVDALRLSGHRGRHTSRKR
jgi:hypothetical protein